MPSLHYRDPHAPYTLVREEDFDNHKNISHDIDDGKSCF